MRIFRMILASSSRQFVSRSIVATFATACAVLFCISADAQILSSKRGLGDSGAYYGDLQAVNAGWYYNWGSTPSSIGTYNADYYPMFWNAPSQTTINNVKALNPKYVLGFNEPERSDQANMTVSAAVSSWDTIYSNFSGTSTRLVSPAVSDTTAGRAWLSSFMAQESSKVDAVAFHWYGDSTPNAAQAIGDFEGSVNLYWNTYQKPVFITEFAIHDWGGLYTDQQIIAANQTFLNSVIPWMESNSHVAGYSWYNWFSDSPLFSGSGSNLTPNPMGYTYIGAVGTGTTTDLGGIDLGEHVADLTGGTLTMTGSAGTVRYINALANSSTITGGLDWGLNSSSNWVRIQSGATLTKSGTNTISFTGGSMNNDGTLQISQGVLQIGVPVTGAGAISITSDGGATGSTARLELMGNVSVNNAITFAQRNDPGGSDGIRNVSGNNIIYGPMTITTGGNQARVRSDASLLTLGSITTNATTARNLYLQGAGNGVVSGAISDNASNSAGQINLTKQDAGTWTLSGANTYTGTTTVSAGTLGFSSSSSNIGSVTVADSAGLRVGAAGVNSTTLTATGLTLGGGGSSSLTLDFDSLDTTAPLVSTGAFTAGGTVNVLLQNGGVLSSGTHKLVAYTSFAGGGTFSGSPFTLGPRSTGTLVNNGTSELDLNVTADRPIWTGADNGNWVVGATGANKNWKLQTAATATDYLEGDNVLFDDSSTGSTTVSINTANVSPAATTFNDSSKTYTVTGAFGIGGSGRLTKNGTGTVTLSTTNTYTGTTTINAGTLSISANGNLGASSAPVVLNGGTLKTTNSGTLTNTHAFTIAGGSTININSTGSAGTGQLFFNTQNTLLGNGPLTVTGNGTLTTTGAGNLRVAQTNTYSGNMTMQSGGIFEYGVAGAVGNSATFTIANQGELAVQGNSTVALSNNVTVTGGTNSVLSFENGTTGTFSGNITLAANATVGLRNWYSTGGVTGGTIAGAITGSGGLTVNSGTGSGGLLTLSNSNGYSGGTTLSASKVLASTNAALGTGSVTVGGTSAQLELASGVNLANAITINSGAGSTAQGIIWVPTSGASATVSGPITINAAQSAGGHFAANGGSLTVTGKITSSVPVTARIGTVVFTNTTSSYSQLSVQQGTVELGAASAIPVGATIDLGQSGGATFDLDGFNQTLVGVTKNTNSATVTNSGATLSTLTTTGTYTYSGIIQDGTSAVGVTINGGTATLSGANTYTGGTGLSSGTLILANDGALGTGTLTLSGGTLKNNAAIRTIADAISVSASTSTNIRGGGTTSGQDFTLNGNISGSGNLDLAGVLNNTRVYLSGNDSAFTGTATVSGVNVALNSFNAGSAAAAWVVNASSGLQLSAGAGTYSLGSLAGSGNVGTIISGAAVLSVGAANTSTTLSGTITNTSTVGNTGGSGTVALTKVGTGTWTLSGANTYTGGTTVNAGTLVVGHVNALGTAGLTINGTAIAKLQSGLTAPVQLPGLTIAGGATPTAKLDVTNNNLVLHNGNIAMTLAQLKTGLNSSGTLWTGAGIQSSTAAADAAVNSNATVFAVGAIKNIDQNSNLIYSTWPAAPSPDTGASGLTTTDVLVKYTYFGDADLNGVVDNTTDYDLWSNGFTNPGLAATNGWLYGDFDFSGIVDNTTDYDLWSTGFAHQGGPLTAGSASPAPATDVQAVPEPGGLLLIGLAIGGVIPAAIGSRRRRREGSAIR
jgi:fibronectin-binding autotransporter adhesin